MSLESILRRPSAAANSHSTFTFTDLLVVLALVALPALAGIQSRGDVAQCADNLRQIGMESMVYVNESGGWLPIVDLGNANADGLVNNLGGIWYTRWMWRGTPYTQLSNSNTTFQNLGLIYRAGLAGNGKIFYGPAQWDSAPGANSYSPLLTSDASGFVRSSYEFNLLLADVFLELIKYPRHYQKTSQLEPHKLFAVDYSENPTGNTVPGIPPPDIPHTRERGWNVLFTDGSVQFSRNVEALYLATHFLITGLTAMSAPAPAQLSDEFRASVGRRRRPMNPRAFGLVLGLLAGWLTGFAARAVTPVETHAFRNSEFFPNGLVRRDQRRRPGVRWSGRPTRSSIVPTCCGAAGRLWAAAGWPPTQPWSQPILPGRTRSAFIGCYCTDRRQALGR